MTVLIVPDSFKETLSAIQVGSIIAKEFAVRRPDYKSIVLPLSDGGEGFIDTFLHLGDGYRVPVQARDPLNRPITASYGVNIGAGEAIIEIAASSGLHLLKSSERNPFYTSSYGTGLVIRAALEAGFRKFIVGLGGSATNDAGVGMLQALGMRFLDRNGRDVRAGGIYLADICDIDTDNFSPSVGYSEFQIACDVTNVLVGPDGASMIYGPQKGGSVEMCRLLDQNLAFFASVVESKTGINPAIAKSGGAAGGLGAAFMAFFPSEICSGIEMIVKYAALDQKIKQADLIITGEGRFDNQSRNGKLVSGILKLTEKYNKRVLVVAGRIEKEAIGCARSDEDYISLEQNAGTMQRAMAEPEYWLARTIGAWIEKRL